MLVSWKWLSRYVDLAVSHEELSSRLSLSGLNHEGTETVHGDVVIDLEVTSNRGDCLGHVGVAREISVLYGSELKKPEPSLVPSSEAASDLLAVSNEFPEACSRYTARVIRGVKVGPSPDWLVEALRSVDIASVNNVVDVTNFVMLECGQPLHAFDHAKVAGKKIVVRPAGEGELIQAIDHRQYKLDPSMCVIADAEQPIAVAGVMGGADSEVTESTTDVVIEAAVFTPLSVRRTARSLKLHSPSSFRFERRVDPIGVEWASRRACELIIEIAGGAVADGMLETAPAVTSSDPVVIRDTQIERVLGISINRDEVERILVALGCTAAAGKDEFVPPSWRHDLTREADLIEEVARIYGYDKIPEDSPIPVAPSTKRPFDTAMEKIRGVLTAAGLSEAMTPSVVTSQLDETLSPWTDRPSLKTATAMLKGSNRLRRSLLPSLIEGRGNNWASASIEADLFEIAHIYLPGDQDDSLPAEQYCLGLISGGDFFRLKGAVETLLQRLGVPEELVVTSVERPGFASGGGCELRIGSTLLGYLGVVDEATLKGWKLPGPVNAAELSLDALLDLAELVPQQQTVSAYPVIQRDLNFVVSESVRWNELQNVVRQAVGDDLAGVTYRETYRDTNKDGEDKKRILLSVELQSHSETLSGDQADKLVGRAIKQCSDQLGALLLS